MLSASQHCGATQRKGPPVCLGQPYPGTWNGSVFCPACPRLWSGTAGPHWSQENECGTGRPLPKPPGSFSTWQRPLAFWTMLWCAQALGPHCSARPPTFPEPGSSSHGLLQTTFWLPASRLGENSFLSCIPITDPIPPRPLLGQRCQSARLLPRTPAGGSHSLLCASGFSVTNQPGTERHLPMRQVSAGVTNAL